MDRRRVAGVFWAFLVAACDSSSGSGDSETHWLKCTTDLDCPSDQYCEAERCVPRSDAGAGAGGEISTRGSGANAGTSTGGGAPLSNGGAPFSNGGAADAGISRGGASAGGAPVATAGGASTGGVSGASSDGGPELSAGGSDASVEGGTVGRDASDASVTLACGAPGSDLFVDPVNGSDNGNGSGKSPSGAPTPECAFKTITHALAALPAIPSPGTRIVVIGPARVDAGETFPITLPANVVLTTQGGDVDLRPTSGVDSIVFLAHPLSGIRGSAGAALTLWPFMTQGVEVAAGSDDTTFLEDVVINGYQSIGIQVAPRARLTVGEGVTSRGNLVGMEVDGHATISVPSGHATTSFSRNLHLNEPPPPMAGNGLVVSGSVTIHGVPGATPETGTVVVSGNCGEGVRVANYLGATPPESVIDGLVVYGNGVSGPSCGGYSFAGMFIAGGSNVKLRNSVVLGNGVAGVEVGTITANDGRRLSDLGKIDLGVATLADGGSDWGHNVLQALPEAGANRGSGLCLFVDHGAGTLNAAGNVFAGPRDCAGASPGALTFSNICNQRTDLGIITQTDGGLFMDAGGTRGNGINAANCTR